MDAFGTCWHYGYFTGGCLWCNGPKRHPSLPGCWSDCYKGIPTIAGGQTYCPPGTVGDTHYCWNKCVDGYTNVGGKCIQNCEAGMTMVNGGCQRNTK